MKQWDRAQVLTSLDSPFPKHRLKANKWYIFRCHLYAPVKSSHVVNVIRSSRNELHVVYSADLDKNSIKIAVCFYAFQS